MAVLAVAFAARAFTAWLSIAHNSAGWIYSRGLEMGYVARSLLTGQGFASPFGTPTGPTALIAPGYPLLVAAVFRTFGIYTAMSAVVIMFVHIAAAVITVWLMMHLAGELFSERAAIVAGLFWALWLPLLWVPTIFWDTSLSICMMTALIALALHIRSYPTSLACIGFGLFCGAAILINMALLITSVAVLFWLAVNTWRTSRYHIGLAGCLMLLIYSPWPVRNARVFHAFVPLRTTVGLELWMGNFDDARGYTEDSVSPVYNLRELNLYRSAGEINYDKQKSTQARAWIAAHPSAFAKLTVWRFFRYWTGTGTFNGSLVYGLGATLTTLGGLAGLFLLYRTGRRDLALLLALPLFLFPLPYYITHAEFRYRLVLDPLLTVLSAYAVTSMLAEKTSGVLHTSDREGAHAA